MNIANIRHIGLFSPDTPSHASFYADVWGLAEVADQEGIRYLRGASPEHYILSLHPGTGRGLHHLAFALDDHDAIDRAAAALVDRGVRITSGPALLTEPGGGYGFRFLDPENRCIELSAGVGTHDDGWVPRTVEPQSICHVVVNTGCFEEIVAFYTDILGFRVSDWSEEQMVFLRCNTKHHVISFNRATYASVNHVAYLMAGVDELMRGIAGMRRTGREPDWGPGRHGPGNNVFCYYKDPLGYVTEYTSDIDFIDDEAAHVPKVWERIPEFMDRWGTAGPPSADIRNAMAGEPDPGWVDARD